MSAKTPESRNSAGYSAFWPVLIVFVTMTIVQSFYLRASLRTREELNTRRHGVQKVLPQARLINQAVENVGKDLFVLSDGQTNEAAKIIAEFNISLSGQPTVSTTAATNPAPAMMSDSPLEK